jgi:excisionase family DNA binding protein
VNSENTMATNRNGTKDQFAREANPLRQMTRTACEDAVKLALNITDISPRRLLSIEETARYLNLCEREVYNLIAAKEIAGVRHGRRLMMDIRDLEERITIHKAA